MKIIISPAKKMKVRQEEFEYYQLSDSIQKSERLLNELRRMTMEDLQKLWKCNDKIAYQNYQRIQQMDLRANLTPAILSYEGIQYQYMAPAVFESSMLEYIEKNLRILSGFYGVLRPMDGVVPYRLEMQAKLAMDDNKNLYEYWGESIYTEVLGEDEQIVINLASKEYSMCIERFLKPNIQFITCIFGEIISGKVVQKGTYAKMARGEMVRYMAENQIELAEDIKGFDRLGYAYSTELSTCDSYVFIK